MSPGSNLTQPKVSFALECVSPYVELDSLVIIQIRHATPAMGG